MAGHDPLTLAADFPAPTHEQWRALVDGVLKGRPYESLVKKTYDGIALEPLPGRSAAAHALAGRAPGASWQIIQRVDLPDPSAANAEALHDLENGATGLSLIAPGAVGEYGYGLDISALPRVLDGVFLDAGVAIDLDLRAGTDDLARSIVDVLRARSIRPSDATIRFGFDPLGATAHAGLASTPWREESRAFAERIRALADEGFAGPFAAADGRVIHAAGGSEAQELAFVLSSAIAYLRALEASGMPLEAARDAIFFRTAADADQFVTIAKMRALRRLWARVEAACGLAPRPAFIAVETAWRMMTRRDPHVNMLRATIATFAAAVGGADAITVLPLTLALGLPDRFARRVARNTQLVLAEEANLARVADPGAGSSAIEALTDALCAKASALLQEIESAGGASEALARGLIQQQVAKARAEREQAVARRREGLTGVSEFPNLAELPAAVLDAPRAQAASVGHGALARIRLAEPFEALRDAADRLLENIGARPRVFLANLGKPTDFLARATFAKNFFEAGGIEAVTNDGFTEPSALATAYATSGAKLVCICSSDDIYGAEAEAAATALAKAGAARVYLAGRAGEREVALKAAGVGGFIFAGCDVLAMLRETHEILAQAPAR